MNDEGLSITKDLCIYSRTCFRGLKWRLWGRPESGQIRRGRRMRRLTRFCATKSMWSRSTLSHTTRFRIPILRRRGEIQADRRTESRWLTPVPSHPPIVPRAKHSGRAGSQPLLPPLCPCFPRESAQGSFDLVACMQVCHFAYALEGQAMLPEPGPLTAFLLAGRCTYVAATFERPTRDRDRFGVDTLGE